MFTSCVQKKPRARRAKLPFNPEMMFGLIAIVGVLVLTQVTEPIRSANWSHRSHTRRSPLLIHQSCTEDNIGKFLKDRYSCDKFLYCAAKGNAISVDCPAGMIFNDRKEICDFSWNYHCDVEPLPQSSTTEVNDPTTTTKPTEWTSSQPTYPTTTTTNPCPRDDTGNIVFLPDISDCRRYYICYHGYPKPQECIRELYWNQQMKRCDFPENVQCPIATTTTQPSKTVTNPVPAVITCPSRGQKIFPHPSECNYFIYCVNGYATVQQCPFFHYYDVKTKTCMWQTIAKCVKEK